jgi:hypothetical protein
MKRAQLGLSTIFWLLLNTATILTIILHYFSGLKSVPLHLDEWLFMGKSYYFDLLFAKHDIEDPRWFTNNRYFSQANQPKLGPYIYGFALHLNKINNIELYLKEIKYDNISSVMDPSANQQLVYDSYNWLTSKEGRSFQKIILIGRKTSTYFAIASLLMLFHLCIKISGPTYAFLSLLSVSTHPLFLLVSRRAMTDSMLLFFTLLSLLLIKNQFESIKQNSTLTISNRAVIALRNLALCNPNSSISWFRPLHAFSVNAILTGILIGLALSTKVTGILIIPFLALISLIYLEKNSFAMHTLRQLATNLFLTLSTSLIFLVFLHPYLYTNTFQNIFGMFTDRYEYEVTSTKNEPSRKVNSRLQAFETVYNNLIFHRGTYSLFRHRTLPVNEALLIFGAIMLIHKAKISSKKIVSWEIFILSWFFVTFTALIFYLHADWPRYYLLAFIPIVLIECYGIEIIINYLWKKTYSKWYSEAHLTSNTVK